MKKILIQFDTDAAPSTFDRVVAVDAGVEELFSYGGVTAESVTPLVHGAIFTRGPADLKNTAIFVGGSRAEQGETVFRRVLADFFGPMRVSVMMDSNGCNTTAAAAVVAARQHMDIEGIGAVVLGATGPVGQRVVQLLGAEGANVTVVSRSEDRAAAVCDTILATSPDVAGKLRPAAATSESELLPLCEAKQLIVAAGAAGVSFLSSGRLAELPDLQVAIDLNAVPPTGIADIDPSDKAVQKHGVICYGALGVGGTKMKVHKRAIAELFESNDAVLDTARIYQIALRVAGLSQS